MKISGFTMVRNAEKYCFPVKESIESILPIVDEFIVALGNNDEGDHTEELIRSINSPKIKIFHRVWDQKNFSNSLILSEETNFALQQCTGDWCFYLQADEVVHERDLSTIQKACEQYLQQPKVDALLFKYHHFWGDYEHYLPVHGWYKNEIRLVRNHKNIVSIKDAQSFRYQDDRLLPVVEIDAYIYHYGWVRPPWVMQSKKKAHDSMHHGLEQIEKVYETLDSDFHYGDMRQIPVFQGTHPAVMKNYIQRLNWQKHLQEGNTKKLNRPKMKHEKLKYRAITWIENKILGRSLFGYWNWVKAR